MTTKDVLALALEALEHGVMRMNELGEARGCMPLHEAIAAIKQAQEPVDTEYFGLGPWERDKPISPTAGMNIAQRVLHVGGRNNEAGYVEFGSIQAVEALVRQVLRDLPAPKQAEPEGYKLVPVEPTQEMCDAARWSEYGEETSSQYEVSDDFIKSVWDSLLAAAPNPPEAK
jgi:hypothetical protein